MKLEYISLKSFTVFRFLYTTPAVDIANGRSHSKEVHPELLSKKAKVRLY